MNHGRSNFKQEIEFKWQVYRASDFQTFLGCAANLGAQIGKPKSVRIHDVYLDTENRSFSKQHIKLRLRQIGSKWECTLKTHSPIKRGLVKRQEKNFLLPGASNRQAAIFQCEKKLSRSFTDVCKLIPLFEFKNRREVRPLVLNGGVNAELSFDDLLMWRGRRRAHMKEIELELKAGSLSRLQTFTDHLTRTARLKRTRCSKVATAVRALLPNF